MSKNYQEQFDIAHEVLEITHSDGFKTLLAALNEKISQVNTAIGRLNSDMLSQVENGVHSEHYTQRMIALESELKGLRFIIRQVDFQERAKEDAAKHLD